MTVQGGFESNLSGRPLLPQGQEGTDCFGRFLRTFPAVTCPHCMISLDLGVRRPGGRAQAWPTQGVGVGADRDHSEGVSMGGGGCSRSGSGGGRSQAAHAGSQQQCPRLTGQGRDTRGWIRGEEGRSCPPPTTVERRGSLSLYSVPISGCKIRGEVRRLRPGQTRILF